MGAPGVMTHGDAMPYVTTEKFNKLLKEAEKAAPIVELQYEKAVWYSRRNAMRYGADEDKLRVAIFEYYRKRDLRLDYHERMIYKRWRWETLDYW